MEVNEIPIIKNKNTVAIAGYIIDVTEKKKVEAGLIEAEILLKNYAGMKKRRGDQTVNEGQGPFSTLKSLFFPKKTEDDGDISLDIPDVLK